MLEISLHKLDEVLIDPPPHDHHLGALLLIIVR